MNRRDFMKIAATIPVIAALPTLAAAAQASQSTISAATDFSVGDRIIISGVNKIFTVIENSGTTLTVAPKLDFQKERPIKASVINPLQNYLSLRNSRY